MWLRGVVCRWHRRRREEQVVILNGVTGVFNLSVHVTDLHLAPSFGRVDTQVEDDVRQLPDEEAIDSLCNIRRGIRW